MTANARRLADCSVSRRPYGVFNHFADCRCELVHPSARNNDRIPAAMGFLGNSQELSTLVLAEFHVKVFPFDLELPCFDDVVHFKKTADCTARRSNKGRTFCKRLVPRKKLLPPFTLKSARFANARFGGFPFICQCKIDLALKCVHARDENTHLITDSETPSRSSAEQAALRGVKLVEIIIQR